MLHPFKSNPARLFIPTGAEGIEALKWRLRLIDSEKIYSAEKLLQTIKDAQEKKTDPRAIKKLVQFAQSDSIVLEYPLRLVL